MNIVHDQQTKASDDGPDALAVVAIAEAAPEVRRRRTISIPRALADLTIHAGRGLVLERRRV